MYVRIASFLNILAYRQKPERNTTSKTDREIQSESDKGILFAESISRSLESDSVSVRERSSESDIPRRGSDKDSEGPGGYDPSLLHDIPIHELALKASHYGR